MAIKNFLPTVWSETLYQKLDKQYIAVANCNRDFDGDIKNLGSVVKICGVGNVDVFDYTKNTDMYAPQMLSDTVKEIAINRARGFNFQIDDVDRAQAAPKLMEAAMKNAASALADDADEYVFSLLADIDNEIIIEEPTEQSVIDAIFEARKTLYENNVTDSNEVVIEVSPATAQIILKAKAQLATDNTETLEKGCLGTIAGCKIFVSNNVYISEEPDYTYHYCTMRTKRAVAFAEQISDIEAYRPEKRFADAVKGLHLYGAAIVYPEEVVSIKVGFPV